MDKYQEMFHSAIELMNACPGLEPTSALKQVASDAGVAEGEEMREFVTWAHEQIGRMK